mmetsp:Transcript_12308/g.15274  ORF Transcript_12308/g.15274 Transcript_12308/m.15274 type:complete len:375 (+) Transcript_12308:158-1282(+)|eukprot:CAMPEP_0204891882 /NCGR_PEP_ID=MMETSP1349-20130617/28306_1 /ASSEMBLY_ACC=CAM_ASM_000710 /TAXON_ID=215587 /ORGANISM="Aplanochytrium stocchinoi, Strain GSBS06" /LENGTH=374 /DNA_ID=CAMNT_0052057541 /DNA_START=131 /DNA_END=1255 /DNA_ORIENTATION=+
MESATGYGSDSESSEQYPAIAFENVPVVECFLETLLKDPSVLKSAQFQHIRTCILRVCNQITGASSREEVEAKLSLFESLSVDLKLKIFRMIGDIHVDSYIKALDFFALFPFANIVLNMSIDNFDAMFKLSITMATHTSMCNLRLRLNIRPLTTGINDNSSVVLCSILQSNSSLGRLDLFYNELNDTHASYIAHALRSNTSLKSLKLNNNGIGDIGMCALAHMLESNTSLTDVDVSGNRMSRQGAFAFGDALKKNRTLRWLYIGSNKLGKLEIEHIACSLQTNDCLAFLNVSDCFIRDEGAISIAECLSVNKSLVDLNLDSCAIGSRGAQALAAAILHDRSFNLSIAKNEIGMNGREAFINVMKSNENCTICMA